MNAEALFRFEGAFRGIDFCKRMVGLCREGIVRLLTYFKRRYRKIERKWCENDRSFFDCGNQNFDCGNQNFDCDISFFDCDHHFFDCDHPLFDCDPSLFEFDRNFFDCDTSFFERAESFVKMTQALTHLTQVLTNLNKVCLFEKHCGSSLLHDLATRRIGKASKITEQGNERQRYPLVICAQTMRRTAYAVGSTENPYVFASSGMANADLAGYAEKRKLSEPLIVQTISITPYSQTPILPPCVPAISPNRG
jgi:hypothetical protein